MSVLSTEPQKLIKDVYDVHVTLNDPRVNAEYVNQKELGVHKKEPNEPLQRLTFDIVHRVMVLFEELPVDVLNKEWLTSSIDRIITSMYSNVELEDSQFSNGSTKVIRYSADKHSVLEIRLTYKEWAC